MNRGFFTIQPDYVPIVRKTADTGNLTVDIRRGGTNRVLDTITVPLKQSMLQEEDLVPIFHAHSSLAALPGHEQKNLMTRIITYHNKLLIKELVRSRYL